MMQFAAGLQKRKLPLHYIEASKLADTAAIAAVLKRLQIRSVQYGEGQPGWLAVSEIACRMWRSWSIVQRPVASAK